MVIQCKFCHGTGDWRGLFAIGKPDCGNSENICYHCNGTGQVQDVSNNTCKYCGKPTDGYCCKECFQEFEEIGTVLYE